jgi:ankyrin repeat protein
VHDAAAYGHAATCGLLHALGVEVDAKTKTGCTPLHLAVGQGADEARQAEVRLGSLLGCKDAIETAKTKTGCTPLHLAVGQGVDEARQAEVRLGSLLGCKDAIKPD